MLLAGDIGGTKTTLAIYRSVHEIDNPLQRDRFFKRRFWLTGSTYLPLFESV